MAAVVACLERLLLQPVYTLALGASLRSSLLRLLSHIVDAQLAAAAATAVAGPLPEEAALCVALVKLLELAPHCSG